MPPPARLRGARCRHWRSWLCRWSRLRWDLLQRRKYTIRNSDVPVIRRIIGRHRNRLRRQRHPRRKLPISNLLRTRKIGASLNFPGSHRIKKFFSTHKCHHNLDIRCIRLCPYGRDCVFFQKPTRKSSGMPQVPGPGWGRIHPRPVVDPARRLHP